MDQCNGLIWGWIKSWGYPCWTTNFGHVNRTKSQSFWEPFWHMIQESQSVTTRFDICGHLYIYVNILPYRYNIYIINHVYVYISMYMFNTHTHAWFPKSLQPRIFSLWSQFSTPFQLNTRQPAHLKPCFPASLRAPCQSLPWPKDPIGLGMGQ